MTARELALALTFVLTVGCTAKPDDGSIERTLHQSLSADTSLRDVAAASSKGEVTLSGTVASELDRSRAEEIAHRVDGVVRVRNQLTVTAPPPVASPPPPVESTPESSTHEGMMDGTPMNHESMMDGTPMNPGPSPTGDDPAGS